jgi:hypothetical protein
MGKVAEALSVALEAIERLQETGVLTSAVHSLTFTDLYNIIEAVAAQNYEMRPFHLVCNIMIAKSAFQTARDCWSTEGVLPGIPRSAVVLSYLGASGAGDCQYTCLGVSASVSRLAADPNFLPGLWYATQRASQRYAKIVGHSPAGRLPSDPSCRPESPKKNIPLRGKIAFACSCGQKLRAPANLAGKYVVCQNCRKTLMIPLSSASAVDGPDIGTLSGQ